MSSSLIIGQYIPSNSKIHQLDPRTKIIIIFLFIVFVFFANNALSYAWLTLFALTSAFLTKIQLRYIAKGLTLVWFLIIFTFILNLFVSVYCVALFYFFGLSIYYSA